MIAGPRTVIYFLCLLTCVLGSSCVMPVEEVYLPFVYPFPLIGVVRSFALLPKGPRY